MFKTNVKDVYFIKESIRSSTCTVTSSLSNIQYILVYIMMTSKEINKKTWPITFTIIGLINAMYMICEWAVGPRRLLDIVWCTVEHSLCVTNEHWWTQPWPCQGRFALALCVRWASCWLFKPALYYLDVQRNHYLEPSTRK